jgi:hypothetical protein
MAVAGHATVRHGHFASWLTFCDTLPKTISLNGPRPRRPMTIRSASSRAAHSTIRSPGLPSSIAGLIFWTPWRDASRPARSTISRPSASTVLRSTDGRVNALPSNAGAGDKASKRSISGFIGVPNSPDFAIWRSWSALNSFGKTWRIIRRAENFSASSIAIRCARLAASDPSIARSTDLIISDNPLCRYGPAWCDAG